LPFAEANKFEDAGGACPSCNLPFVFKGPCLAARARPFSVVQVLGLQALGPGFQQAPETRPENERECRGSETLCKDENLKNKNRPGAERALSGRGPPVRSMAWALARAFFCTKRQRGLMNEAWRWQERMARPRLGRVRVGVNRG